MWRDRRVVGAALAASLACAGTAHGADETSVPLVRGEGAVETRSACSACHSLDYIVMNSPFLDAPGWEKTVTKMVKVMGAPIAPDQATIIVRYLATNYGAVPVTRN
jgi:mono/diheme cytochrome c family protein